MGLKVRGLCRSLHRRPVPRGMGVLLRLVGLIHGLDASQGPSLPRTWIRDGLRCPCQGAQIRRDQALQGERTQDANHHLHGAPLFGLHANIWLELPYVEVPNRSHCLLVFVLPLRSRAGQLLVSLCHPKGSHQTDRNVDGRQDQGRTKEFGVKRGGKGEGGGRLAVGIPLRMGWRKNSTGRVRSILASATVKNKNVSTSLFVPKRALFKRELIRTQDARAHEESTFPLCFISVVQLHTK